MLGKIQRDLKKNLGRDRGWLAVVLVSALVTPLGVGCGSNQGTNSPEMFDHGSLDEVGEIYRSTANRLKKPPKSLKDLAIGKEQFLLGYNSVADGSVIVYWGVEPTAGDQPTDEILGYRANVPTEGGAVLLRNTMVKKLTAEEFKAAPKPAGPTSK